MRLWLLICLLLWSSVATAQTRPTDYSAFTSYSTSTISALTTAITRTGAVNDYAWLQPGTYTFANPIVINRTGTVYIHCLDRKSTILTSTTPSQPLFENQGGGLVQIAGCNIFPTQSAQTTVNTFAFWAQQTTAATIEFLDDIVTLSTLEFDGPGSYRLQAPVLVPGGAVSSSVVLNHPQADVFIFGGDSSNGPSAPLFSGDFAHVWQHFGRLRIYGTSVEGSLGNADIRIETNAGPLGPHVLSAVRSEGANGFLSQSQHVTVGATTGTFTASETLNWTNGAHAIYVKLIGTTLYFQPVSGTIATAGQTITGATSGATASTLSALAESPSRLLYVPPTTASVDVVLKGNGGAWATGPVNDPANCKLVSYNGTGKLWLLGNRMDSGQPCGLALVEGVAPGATIVSIGNEADSPTPFLVTGYANLFTADDLYNNQHSTTVNLSGTMNGSATISLPNTTGVQVGYTVSGLNVPASEFVVSCAPSCNSSSGTSATVTTSAGMPTVTETVTFSDGSNPIVRWLGGAGSPPPSIRTSYSAVPPLPVDTIPAYIPRPPMPSAMPGLSDVKAVYGAHGDNSTDDTSALQTALNAGCVVGGGTAPHLYFPAGTYIISSVLYANSRSNSTCNTGNAFPYGGMIVGAGSATTIIKQTFASKIGVFETDGMSWATIQGITFQTWPWVTGDPNNANFSVNYRVGCVGGANDGLFCDGTHLCPSGTCQGWNASQLNNFFDVVFDGGHAGLSTGQDPPTGGQCSSQVVFGGGFKNSWMGFNSGHQNAIFNAAVGSTFSGEYINVGSYTSNEGLLSPGGEWFLFQSSATGTKTQDALYRASPSGALWYYYGWTSDAPLFFSSGSTSAAWPIIIENSTLNTGGAIASPFSLASAVGIIFLDSTVARAGFSVGNTNMAQSYGIKLNSQIPDWPLSLVNPSNPTNGAIDRLDWVTPGATGGQ